MKSGALHATSERVRLLPAPCGTGLLILALAFAACAEEEVSPEERLRTLVAQAEDHAEAQDVAALGEIISERYLDGRGFTKQNLGGLLAYYFNAHNTIHLLARVDQIAFPDEKRAQMGLFVAMAGTPISGPDALTSLNATLYRFDFTFAEEEDAQWRLVQAQWRRASPADFL